jgi:alpha-galactosidase
MKRLADYAHARGLKFGFHTAPGTHDCGGDPVGGYGHEAVHVKQFAEWGLDLVKVDKCKLEPGWTEDKVKATYTRWGELLAHSGREMIFSISAYEYRDWYPNVCHMARTTYDIRSRSTAWRGLTIPSRGQSPERDADCRTDNQSALCGQGYWNDLICLNGKSGLAEEQRRTAGA